MEDTKLKAKAELNLKLLMWIKILSSAWFWLAIWILYYLKFTDYSGIGIIEAIGFIIGVILEIPAGITSDKFGHRNNIIIYTLLSFIGFSLYASADGFIFIIVSVIFARGSSAFLSGSFESLTHESLHYLKRSDEYQEYVSKVSGLSLIVMAFSALIGGFVWNYSFNLSLAKTHQT
jgi:MFS family permease